MARPGVWLAAVLLAGTFVLVAVTRLVGPGPDPGAVPPGGPPYSPVGAAPARQPARPATVTTTDDGLPQIDAAWLSRVAAGTAIPETALRAYARATLRAPRRCGLGWTTLAAIGWVESQHGTIGGRVLDLDGTSSTPIVGPALDGRGGFGAVRARRAGTTLHGDPRWDHAVGPMQFITATWQAWGADGDGDGTADPHDLDDAAWAAARYLCADGRDLTSGPGWSDGIFSYNRSRAYLDDIYATATRYAERAPR